MKINKIYLTENDCYKAAGRIKPSGIVVHSTGADNPYIHRYVAPDDGILGANRYNNHWNRPGVEKCVHAFVGLTDTGGLAVYQTLPWDFRAWGVGSGPKGSFNSTHIQFEICEDDLSDESYFLEVWRLAQELCAYLCREYGISPDAIVDHREAHALGYASNHGDITHWAKRFGRSMDEFRAAVAALLSTSAAPDEDENTAADEKSAADDEDMNDMPVLRLGAEGRGVKLVQTGLILRGFALKKYGADGDWGAETDAAFRAFQTACGVNADGVCDKNDWARLAR